MYRLKSFLMALPLVFLLTGCPDDGDHGGGGGAEGSSGTIVYLADQNTIGVFELYLASSGAKLNPSLPAGRSVTSFALTPDKTAVVYMADQTTDDIFELYRVNIATPGVSVKLNGTVIPVGGDVSSFAITPDGTSVVYLADQSIDQVFELFQVLFSTPQASVRLNPIFPSSRTVTQFAVTADNARVVYIADQDTDNVNELYQVALFNPPSNNTKLNSPLLPEGNVIDFAIAPNSSSVVYLADQTIDQVFEIYRAGITTPGTGTSLNPPLIVGQNVRTFAVTPDSAAVIYRADQTTTGVTELYRVLFANPQTSATKLNGALAPGGNVSRFAIAPDGSAVVYSADQDILGVVELYRVPLTPVAANQKINPNYVAGQNVTRFAITPDNRAVVYMANQTVGNAAVQLYHVPFSTLQQSSPPLNGAVVAGGNVTDFTVAPGSANVFYVADQTTFGMTELYVSNVGSPGQSTKLNGALITGGNVAAFTF